MIQVPIYLIIVGRPYKKLFQLLNSGQRTHINIKLFDFFELLGSESPVFDGASPGGAGAAGNSMRLTPSELPNEISAPYEVPQFPIEQIEKKLLIQRQLNVK